MVSVNCTVAVRKFECWNLESVNPNQMGWWAVRMISCYSHTVSSYMCQFSAEFNLSLMMKKSLYLHSPVKSNFGESKWSRRGLQGEVTNWHAEEISLSFPFIQGILRRPVLFRVPQTASSVSGPTGLAAVNPVGVGSRFGLNGFVKNPTMVEDPVQS